MKFPHALCLLPLLSLAAGPLHAQETAPAPVATDGGDKLLRIQVEWVEVEALQMTELLREGAASDTALRESVQKLIEDRDATLVETALVTARSGQRAKVESIHEHIYPTEFQAPEVINPEGEKGSKTVLILPHPTAFETRNLGVTLEVDPVLGADGKTIDLNLAPELVYLVGEQSWAEYEGDLGTSSTRTPSIYTAKTTTQVATTDGEYCLLSAQSPQNVETGMTDGSRKLMAFVRVDVVSVSPPAK